jgi:glutamate dehydrogenase/leucine dehydrogenase
LNGNEGMGGVTVAIKGIGKLGGELARLVVEAGGDVTIADVDEAACERLVQQFPNIRTVSVEEIRRQETVVYAPCALGNEFTEENIAELRCRAIVGGANNQLSHREVGKLLQERSILYAPDYVANAGGLIYVSDELEPGGFSQQRVLQRARAIQDTMEEVFRQSETQGLPTNYVADGLAWARIKEGSHD